MLAVVMGFGAVVALVAEAVLEEVARRLVQSLHDDGTVVDLHHARRAQCSGFARDGRRIRLAPGRLAPGDLVLGADVAQFPDTEVTVVVGLSVRVRDPAARLAEQRPPRTVLLEGVENPLLGDLGHDLPPRCLVVGDRQAVRPVVRRDLVAEEQSGEDGRVRVPGQFTCPFDVGRGVVEAWHDRTPVQDGAVPLGVLVQRAQAACGDGGVDGLDRRVRDVGVRDEDGQAQVGEAVEDGAVLGRHPPTRDDQYVVGQAPLIQRPQHVEHVRLDDGEHGVRGPVQELDGRLVRPEVRVPHEAGDGLLVRREAPGSLHLEVVEEVPDAVPALQRAADDPVQRQPRLPVLDHIGEFRLESADLVRGQDGQSTA